MSLEMKRRGYYSTKNSLQVDSRFTFTFQYIITATMVNIYHITNTKQKFTLFSPTATSRPS